MKPQGTHPCCSYTLLVIRIRGQYPDKTTTTYHTNARPLAIGVCELFLAKRSVHHCAMHISTQPSCTVRAMKKLSSRAQMDERYRQHERGDDGRAESSRNT